MGAFVATMNMIEEIRMKIKKIINFILFPIKSFLLISFRLQMIKTKHAINEIPIRIIKSMVLTLAFKKPSLK